MAVKPVPEGYHTVTPYLVVNEAPRVLEFLATVFGATLRFKMMRPDGLIGHAEVQIGDSMIMISEASDQYAARPAMLYLYLPDVDTLYQRALDAGATSVSEPADQFYGDRHCGVEFPSGHQWWIATHIEDVSPEELERRAAAKFGAA
jgi:PhnB protein